MPTRHDLIAIARHAMVQRGLLPDFSPAALAEVQRAAERPLGSDPSVREMTDLLWMSVDNDSSRDLDQLSVAAPVSGGLTRVMIAIADVDALVPVDSAVDVHARTNTTTVYTAAGVFSMIPERLSTDLTSLNQDEDRLALIVQLDVGPDGAVEGSDVYRGRVRNRARLNYGDVAQWLDGGGPVPPAVASVSGLAANIQLQDRVARALRDSRHRRGALTLDTVEATVVFAGDELTGLKREVRNRAKELIEDFMIAANTATATFLERKGFPSIRRVLRAPARWDRIVTLAKGLGESLPATPDSAALQAFLVKRQAADPVRFPDLSLSIVKLLGAGQYSIERPGQPVDGHFGLAVKDYTHSTAPNRRFPDLVTHRLLKAAMISGTPPYADGDLDALAQHCTEQANNAEKVERQVRKSAAALLLVSRVGERFDAIVTGASEKGTYVRLIDPPVEGRVVQSFAGYDVGDRVHVELIDTNVEQGFIDFRGLPGTR